MNTMKEEDKEEFLSDHTISMRKALKACQEVLLDSEMDGDNSTRKVFGQERRLDPKDVDDRRCNEGPVTNALASSKLASKQKTVVRQSFLMILVF